jgi:hypothetical protein
MNQRNPHTKCPTNCTCHGRMDVVFVPKESFEDWKIRVKLACLVEFDTDYDDLPDYLDLYQIYCDGEDMPVVMQMIDDEHGITSFLM